MIFRKNLFIVLILVFSISTILFPQSPERSDVPDKYKWNLSEIYPSVEAWQTDVDMLKKEVEKLAVLKERLAKVLINFIRH